MSTVTFQGLVLAVTVTAYVIGSLLYKRYLHPLRKFPGPFLASVTDAYNTWLFSTRQSDVKLLHLHEKYGKYVRIAPNIVSFNDPLLLPQAYHTRVNKTSFYSTGIAGAVPPLLQITDHKEHATKARVLSTAYGMKNLKLGEQSTTDQLILKTMQIFHERFASQNRPVDLAEYIRYFIYDSLTFMIYGEPVGMVEQGSDVDGLIKEWHHVFPLGGLVSTLPWLIHPIITFPYLSKFFMPQKGHRHGSGHIMSRHQELFYDRLRYPEKAKPGNIFDSIRQMKLVDGSRNFTPEEAERECFLVTVGGQDTSPAFMSAFFFRVLEDTRVLNRLLEEIAEFEHRKALSSPVVQYTETTEMPYFSAVVQEVLRLEPSASLILPRHAPEGGLMLDSKLLPEGTEIAANPFIIHRNKEMFGQDADDFRPERWLDGDLETIARMRKYFFAFGYGSRRCLGKNIALFTSSKFCVQLLRQFDVRTQVSPRIENFGIKLYFDQWVTLQSRAPIDSKDEKAGAQ